MSTLQILYIFATVGVVYTLVMLLVSRYLKHKKMWLVSVGLLLLLPSLYIGFGMRAMYNEQYLLAGVQWGLFGGAMFAFTTAWQKHGGNNA